MMSRFKEMKFKWITYLCVLWAATACNSWIDGPDDSSLATSGRTEVPIDLSLSVKGAQERTKANYAIGAGISELVSTQSSPQFRGIWFPPIARPWTGFMHLRISPANLPAPHITGVISKTGWSTGIIRMFIPMPSPPCRKGLLPFWYMAARRVSPFIPPQLTRST